MNTSRNRPRANVLGTAIDAVNMQQALARVEEDLRLRRKGYVCLTGVHGVMESKRDPILANILANASLNVPDGMPTAWAAPHQARAPRGRPTAPDPSLESTPRPESLGSPPFLCGGKPGVAEELR